MRWSARPLVAAAPGSHRPLMNGTYAPYEGDTATHTAAPSTEMMGGSMQLPNTIALYEERLASLWKRLVTTLGIHSVRVLLDRALWQTAQRHPEIALIHHDDAGLTFDAL